MIVHMRPGLPPGSEEVKEVIKVANEHGLRAEQQSITGSNSDPVIIFLKDAEVRASHVATYIFSGMSGVDKVVRVSPALVNLTAANKRRRVIRIGDEHFGSHNPCRLVLGPCTVHKRIGDELEALRNLGVTHVRGGGFKPRSSAGTFRGHGIRGWRWLLEAAKVHDIKSVWTEVIESCHIDQIRRLRDEISYEGSIVLWVGARNLGNHLLLQALGEQRNFPVMLKHGLQSNIKEFLTAAEFVLHGPMHWDDDGELDGGNDANTIHGNDQLMLCVRGLKEVDECDPHRFAPNFHWINRLRENTWAPVVLDPSHMAGKESLVFDDIQSGLTHNPDALLVESILKRDIALCDRDQAIEMERVPKLLEIVAEHNEKMKLVEAV